jgi:peptidoglycan/LPS O-acetylase OafA/YrhL
MAREFGEARRLMIIGIAPALVLMVVPRDWIGHAYFALAFIAYMVAVLLGGSGLIWVYRVSRTRPIDRRTNLVVLIAAGVILAPVIGFMLKEVVK